MNFMAFLLAVRIALVLRVAAGQRSDRRVSLEYNAAQIRRGRAVSETENEPDANVGSAQGRWVPT
jgi:hypothetical protein